MVRVPLIMVPDNAVRLPPPSPCALRTPPPALPRRVAVRTPPPSLPLLLHAPPSQAATIDGPADLKPHVPGVAAAGKNKCVCSRVSGRGSPFGAAVQGTSLHGTIDVLMYLLLVIIICQL